MGSLVRCVSTAMIYLSASSKTALDALLAVKDFDVRLASSSAWIVPTQFSRSTEQRLGVRLLYFFSTIVELQNLSHEVREWRERMGGRTYNERVCYSILISYVNFHRFQSRDSQVRIQAILP